RELMSWMRCRGAVFNGTEGAGARRVEAEARAEQRSVGLDVRAHDDDVAQLERRIVGEHPEEQLTEYFHLAMPSVTGVHLHAVVVLGRLVPVRRRLISTEIRLEVAEQSVGRGWHGDVFVGRRTHVCAQPQLQLASVAAQRA